MATGAAPSGKDTETALACAALVCNAFIWGVSWWFFRELQGYGLHPLWSTALVYLIILACLLPLRFGALREFAARPQLWALAVAAGLANVGFNWAVTVGDVVRVVLLFYLMPAWAVLVAWIMLGERPSGASLLRLLLAMCGVLLVLRQPGSPWPLPQGAADWLAIAGGFSFAVTNVILRKNSDAPGSARMFAMFVGCGLMAALVGLVGMSQNALPGPALQLAGLPVLLVLGAGFALSNAALQYGAARLASGVTAIVMLTEILFASVSSALLGAAELTQQVWLGGSLIVLSAVLSAVAHSTDAGKTEGAAKSN